jgi:hypothetical protein
MSTKTAGQPAGTGNAWASGISLLAGTLLTMLGLLQFFQGVAAVAGDELFVNTPSYTYQIDLTAWGWVHMIIGVVGTIVGIAIILRQVWGYLAGVIVAGLSSISNFLFLPHYPLWAIVLIALDLLVIWALCTQIDERV